MSPSSDMEAFKRVLSESKNVVILAGAGLSAASGIPTYRGAGGLWRSYDATSLATPEAFAENPSRIWQFYHERRQTALKAQPNAAHKALAALSLPKVRSRVFPSLLPPDSLPLFITQNVDGISRRVIGLLPEIVRSKADESFLEMHGTLFKTRCDACKATKRADSNPLCPALGAAQSHMDTEVAIPLEDLPRCEADVNHTSEHQICGGLLRPDVVWFGEYPMHMTKITEALVECDLFLLVGTSSTVYPAAGFADTVAANGGKIAVFNLERSNGDEYADFLFLGPCEETLPSMLDIEVDAVFQEGS